MLAVVISVRASSAACARPLRFTPLRRRESRIHHSVGCALLTKLRSTRFHRRHAVGPCIEFPPARGRRGWVKHRGGKHNHSAIRDSLHPIHPNDKVRFSVLCPSRLAALPPRKARRASQKTGEVRPACSKRRRSWRKFGRPWFSRSTGHPRRRRRRTGARPGSFCLLFGEAKKVGRQAGRTPAPFKPPRVSASFKLKEWNLHAISQSYIHALECM